MMLIQRHASRGNRLILFFLSFPMLALHLHLMFPLWYSLALFLFFSHHFLPGLSGRHHLRYAVFFKQGFSPRTPRQKTPLVQRWESGLINGHEDEDDWKHERRKEEVGPEWSREGESEVGKRARTEGREGLGKLSVRKEGENPSPVSELVHLTCFADGKLSN